MKNKTTFAAWMTLLACITSGWGCDLRTLDAEKTCGEVGPSEFTGDTYHYTLTFDMRETGASWTVTGTMSFASEQTQEPMAKAPLLGRGKTWVNYSYNVEFSESTYTNGDVTFRGGSIFENVSSSTSGSMMEVTCNVSRGYEETNLSALYVNPPTDLDPRYSPFSSDQDQWRAACDSESFHKHTKTIETLCRTTADSNEDDVAFSNEITNVELSLELAAAI